jgi:hypothetical protein
VTLVAKGTDLAAIEAAIAQAAALIATQGVTPIPGEP